MSKAKLSVIKRLAEKGLISPPRFVSHGVQYETMMGSVAYGVASDTSDNDVYGFCMPPKDIVFPHLAGYIPNFSTQIQSFDQYQKHHIIEEDTRKEWDLSIYSIVKYFSLCMDNNPNMIDSLFTAPNMVLSGTKIAHMVRDQRKMFLCKKSWHKFKGYSYSQMNKMKVKNPAPGSRRYETVQKHGYDIKFAYHVVRLLDEVEQILVDHDIDLMRNREQLKSIRRGEWSLTEIEDHFKRKEKELGEVYNKSTLRDRPDEEGIKQLLLNCMEEYYGDLSTAIVQQDKAVEILKRVKQLVEEV